MSGESLYERYKDALKRGHVAAIRGRVDAAVAAYDEAAALAPDRATPHASAATALVRAGRPEDALRYAAAALRLSPGDDASLVARARALAALGRRLEAADAYDVLARAREGAGRLAHAVDAARLGLELAEGRERRRLLTRLIDRLRAGEPDEPGRAALDAALRILDGVALDRGGTAPDEAVSDPARGAGTPPTAAPGDVGGPLGGALSEEAASPPEPRGVLDRDVDPDTDPRALSDAVEAAIAGRDAGVALGRVLDLATLHRRAGRIDAALDACYRALPVAPGSAALHEALATLYEDRGWAALRSEKLELLGRLAALDDGAGAAPEAPPATAR